MIASLTVTFPDNKLEHATTNQEREDLVYKRVWDRAPNWKQYSDDIFHVRPHRPHQFLVRRWTSETPVYTDICKRETKDEDGSGLLRHTRLEYFVMSGYLYL